MATLAAHLPTSSTEIPWWSLVANDMHGTLGLLSFPCTVGRDPGARVRIVDPTVSLFHAEIRSLDHELTITDLSSRNGTFVNGHRLTTTQPIVNGDLLQFGSTAFRLIN